MVTALPHPMARKPKQKPQTESPKTNFEEGAPFDPDATEEDVPAIDAAEPSSANSKSRDWRDVEKYKEMRLLRRLVDDDLDLDDEPRRQRS
jgi:hypothetical protein